MITIIIIIIINRTAFHCILLLLLCLIILVGLQKANAALEILTLFTVTILQAL